MSKLFKNNYKKIVAIFLATSMFSGVYKAYAEGLNSVKLSLDGSWSVVSTSKSTVEDFLESQNINLSEKDTINLSLDTEITNNIKIIIKKAINVNFVLNTGENIEFLTSAETIGKAIVELSSETGKSYKLASGQSSSSKLEEGLEINLLVYEESIKTAIEEIPYSTETIENDQLLSGKENIITAGVNGSKQVVNKEIYLEGELVSTEVISENIISNPINEVVEIGTKEVTAVVSTEKGVFTVEKELTMSSTAYTSSYECTGKNPGDPGYGITASGMKAQRGVVAVDPSIIPLGTELYIEGYGYAIAGDTGGAIKGNKIDLYFDTYNEAIQHGVRSVKVYILGEQI